MPAVVANNLSVKLGKNFLALDKINADIPEGKIVGIIGPSGAGKTTLIRSIVGRQKIEAGSIEVFGLQAGSAKLRSEISYMTQETSVYKDITVEQNLRYFARMYGINRRSLDKEIHEIIDLVDMKKQFKSLVINLSGGQKQRTSLAVALIGQPKLMVLDEPTVGLDPLLRDQIWGLFRKLTSEGKTIIVTSHVMDEASRCDQLLLLREGKILAYDTPDNICRSTGSRTVEESFLKLIGDKR